MSLSLGEHGRVPIGFVGISMMTSGVNKSTSVSFSLAVLLPSEIFAFSMMVAI
jgi:hypothetical protein